jgi:tetratricopeptide (TPR) repeat protein
MHACIFFLSLLFWQNVIGQSPEKILDTANVHYQKGIHATTYLERNKEFNEALAQYLQFADTITAPSAEINAVIADNFFQLNEYAWSILYAERALELDPRNSEIINHLSLTREKMGLEKPEAVFSIWQKLLLNHLFAWGEKIEAFFWFFMITLFAITTVIWRPNQLIKKISLISSSISLLLLFNLLLTFYFSPIEGILISSTGYYREPDTKQPQLTLLPKRAGTKMRILGADLQGSWLKVKDTEGLVGYIPATAIRII